MELVPELFFTAFVAIVFSFLVAKLVYIIICVDNVELSSGFKSGKGLCREELVEELKLDKGLIVKGAESRKEVQFVEDEVVEKVDEFREGGSVDRLEKCDVADGIEVEQSSCDVIELLETSTDVKGVDEVKKKGENGTDLDKVDVKERGEIPKGDEGFAVEEKDKIVNSCLDDLVDEEKIENGEVDNQIGADLTSDGGLLPQTDEDRAAMEGEKNRVMEIEGQLENKNEKENVRLVSDEDDDDWEGIERSDLEKDFAKAANFVNSGGNYDPLSKVSSDVQMQLYGLQKVAMEGPCHYPQPMALMVSARAKWNAWQRLGNMSTEMAMEQYISLLSDKFPGWMQGNSAGDEEPEFSKYPETSDSDPNISISYLDAQENFNKKMELESGFGGGDLTGSSSPPKRIQND